MRPIGVTIIAVLTWIRGAFYVVIGLVLLIVGHLSARLGSTMASDAAMPGVTDYFECGSEPFKIANLCFECADVCS
jgi:NADH:ubiquinone oxidoreductase subunit 3 (subunit A)